MASWQKGQVIKVAKAEDRNASWQNDMLADRQVDKMVNRKREVDKMVSRQNAILTKMTKLASWQNNKLTIHNKQLD
jgi:hypothetical protein